MAKPLGFKAFSEKFISSVGLGISSAIIVSRNPNFIVLVKKYGKHFTQVFVVIYAIALIIWVPIASLFDVIDGIVGCDMSSRIPSAFSLMCKVTETMGPLMLLVLNWRSYGISEKFFFGQLQEITPLAAKLAALPNPPLHDMLGHALRRYLQLAAGAFGLLLISLLPGGPQFRDILEAAFDFWLMLRVFGYWGVSMTMALLRVIPEEVWEASGLPISSWHITALVKVFMLMRSVGREVLEPYLARVHQALRKLPKPADHEKVTFSEVDGIVLSCLSRKDAPVVMGFALPFAVLMSIPIIGPFVILYAQAAAAFLVKPMLTDCSRRK